jgi:cytochrome c553
MWTVCWLAASLLLSASIVHAASSPKKISYNRDIRPLLANSCYTCHGPERSQRKAGLRLDDRNSAVREAIVPGRSAESPLFQRVSSSDPDEQMPPKGSKRPRLPPAAVAIIRQWIDEGARYEPHWAYVRPMKSPPPVAKNAAWANNSIDHFIAAAHEEQGLKPSPDADPRTLARRLRFDLTGLPPSPAEVDAFAADHSPAAYEKLVDRLLASPHFGERMAMYWLDVARYGDSCGYHSDNERTVWLYRDYVVQAFNGNKPFDQFTKEQLAGDLLPGSTDEQKIASGYNRMLQTTEEGGAQAKEYTAKYAADRVRNMGVAWLASTTGCAQCHDHKFDPITQKDFYSLAAFFADVREVATGRQEQTPMPAAEQAARLRQLDAEIAAIQKELPPPLPRAVPAQAGESRRNGSDPKAKPAPAEKSNPAQSRLVGLKRQKDELLQSIPTTLITVAVPPREVRLLRRGNWQDDSGPVMTPAVPDFLGKLEVKGRRPTRLDLAQWLVSRENPLTARVLVNRLWKLLFGQGIVRMLDDFGTQGAMPTHPELLDWLSVELMDSGWNVKHVMKLMVMSRTYQQTSMPSRELAERDPGNQWLARQGRFRLDAEMVRDNALAISGLLVLKLGGPTVKPYQPAGYWSFLNFPVRDWASDHGDNQYRRGLYTFWQRTFLHPSLLAFDASTREECTVERTRSNTPLQALVLLDDPTYVEASRVFAARIVREGGRSEAERIAFAFRQVLQRSPAPTEVALLQKLYEQHLNQYQADEAAARALLVVGDAKPPEGIAPAELAAWTSVARVMVNLHETITRD